MADALRTIREGAYKNAYLDTEQLLHDGFMKAMREQGIEIPTDEAVRQGIDPEKLREAQNSSTGNVVFMTGRPTRSSDLARRAREYKVARAASGLPEDELPPASAEEGHSEMGFISPQWFEALQAMAANTKASAVELFRRFASDANVSGEIEEHTRAIEELEDHCGVLEERFNPLRHRSGLKSRNILENANRVVGNTIESYTLHPIVMIRAGMVSETRAPAIQMRVVGQANSRTGFVVDAIVTAKRDFSGAEAIDYVHASGGGLVTVKRYQGGRWVDTTDDYDVQVQCKEYRPLEQDPELPYGVFVGEKIAKDGKEIILGKLKTDEKEVRFGTCQVFTKTPDLSEQVREIIKAKSGQES